MFNGRELLSGANETVKQAEHAWREKMKGKAAPASLPH
jgi:hypothetical protein